MCWCQMRPNVTKGPYYCSSESYIIIISGLPEHLSTGGIDAKDEQVQLHKEVESGINLASLLRAAGNNYACHSLPHSMHSVCI